jgi:hypothetical protein
MQIGDAVTIAGRVTAVHGEPATHAPELCSVMVTLPGGQTVWVNRGNVLPAPAPAPDPVEAARPRRGRHTKHVAQVQTPEDGARATFAPEA